ncbi:hypothetical protein [Gloeobacter kilaueensis]|nr:hypothetical protein [Gloeobacter kilaueensis]
MARFRAKRRAGEAGAAKQSRLQQLAAGLSVRLKSMRSRKPGEVVFRNALNEQSQTSATQRIQVEVVLKAPSGTTTRASGESSSPLAGSGGGYDPLNPASLGNGPGGGILDNRGDGGLFDNRGRGIFDP